MDLPRTNTTSPRANDLHINVSNLIGSPHDLGLKSTRNVSPYEVSNNHYDIDGKRIWKKSMLSHILSQNPPENEGFDLPFEPFSPNETPRRHFLSSSLHEMT